MALPNNPTPNELVKAVKALEQGGGGGTATDVQVDSTSITSGGVADIKSINGDYNAITNKFATQKNIPLYKSNEYKAFAYIDQIATTGQNYILPTGISKFECSRLNDTNITVGDKILVFAKIYTTDSSYSGYNYVKHRIYLSTITNVSTYGYDVSSELYGIGGNTGNNYYRNIAFKNEIPDISDVVTHDDTVTTESETTFADNYYTKTQTTGLLDTLKSTIIDLIYPIGSIYITVENVNPETYLTGTAWVAIAEGRTLWSTTTANTGGDLISAGLPNIKGNATRTMGAWNDGGTGTGALSRGSQGGQIGSSGTAINKYDLVLNAHNYNNIYDDSVTTVQPPAIKVYMWKRIANPSA